MTHGVLDELALGVILGCYWRCDLTRPFIPMLSASGASIVFGFGVSTCRFPQELLNSIARWSEKHGSYAVLDADPTGATRMNRFGDCLQLDINWSDFKDVMCVRCRYPDHINILEGETMVLWLRWLLRTRSHHCSRFVLLIDSSVLLGAASKGRSSTCLIRVLRTIAALELAWDLQVHLVLVPSLEHLADDPSRGKRKRQREKPALAQPTSPRDWSEQRRKYRKLKSEYGDLVFDLPPSSLRPSVPIGSVDGL